MSISVEPAFPNTNSVLKITVRYQGPVPPLPNDLHIEIQKDSAWQDVTSYDHIPAGMNPVAGIDLSVVAGNPNIGAGDHVFRVRWTLDGEQLVAPETIDVTVKRTTKSWPEEIWDFLKKNLGRFLDAIGQVFKNR